MENNRRIRFVKFEWLISIIKSCSKFNIDIPKWNHFSTNNTDLNGYQGIYLICWIVESHERFRHTWSNIHGGREKEDLGGKAEKLMWNVKGCSRYIEFIRKIQDEGTKMWRCQLNNQTPISIFFVSFIGSCDLSFRHSSFKRERFEKKIKIYIIIHRW